MASEAQSLPNCHNAPNNQKVLEIRSITLFLCAFCEFLWLKNPFNQRNPRLINYLRTFGIFTTVEDSLQIKLFMQNEPKFRKSQVNVNNLLTNAYEKMDTWSTGKNEPKTNPNEPKFKKAQMNVNKVLTKDYENISNWALYENEPKTNPNKPNFKGAFTH